MVSEPGSNNKLFAYIKDMKCDSSGVAQLKKDGINYLEPTDKVEILNEQFVSAFTKEDCTLIPIMGNSTVNSMPPLNIQVNRVKKLLLSQKPHKAGGPDQVSPRFLKEMASPIAPSLTLIYQASYKQGQVPGDWKSAFVTPLFKKGDKSKASNYRPVSLTSYCCKVMEHIVHSHLMKFLKNNKILSNYQHGFRKKRSCETQLITTVHDLAIGLDRRQQVDAILLDFSKAFDKVPHQRLAVKLHDYGIRDKNLSWIQSFLVDRNQQMVLDERHHLMLLSHPEFHKPHSTSLAVKLHHYGIRDKNLSWIQSFLADRNQEMVLDERHHLVLLSHPEFHKAQCLDLSCSWYTSMTCPQEFPLQYDFLLMIVYCTESYETNRMQRHYRQILIIYRNGREWQMVFIPRQV